MFFFSMDDDCNESCVVFAHQSLWQQRLMRRYGNDMCLIDATHNCTAYGLPLFGLCVPTNVGYVVVAYFLLTDEKSTSIEAGLQLISSWNPDWKPKYFLSDYDEGQIAAVERIFPGRHFTCCSGFLCFVCSNFHPGNMC